MTVAGRLYKNKTGKNLSNLSKSTSVDMTIVKWMETENIKIKAISFLWTELYGLFKKQNRSQFRDNLDLTTGAVNSFDAVGLFMGATGFNLEGAAGVIIGELFSEIVDVITITTTGPYLQV